MKRVKLLASALLLACILGGCGGSEIESPIQDVVGEPITTQAPNVEIQEPSIEKPTDSEETKEPSEVTEDGKEKAATPTIEEREVVEGKKQSYLTGEWKDEATVNRRAMAVMMPNNKAAMPQYGISRASIIYEAPVEGRITRLMCFIEDYDDLDHVGPVRSSRDYYVYEAMAYDAIYCNWGLAIPYVEDLLKSDRIDNVSEAVKGIHNPSAEAFGRIDRPGYKTEYTGYMFIDGYKDAVKRHKYENEYRDTFEQAFTFANDGWEVTYDDCEEATVIYPGKGSNKGGYGNSQAYFKYNPEDGLYYRYQFDEPQVDELNDEQLAVSNVVFKICHGEVRDENDYLAFGVHGTGDAYVFTAGKVIKATWSRLSDTGANYFYDEDGNEIVFNQGKTWICNVWKEYSEYMDWE